MARDVVVSAKRRIQEAELALRTAQMDVETLNAQQSGESNTESKNILFKNSRCKRMVQLCFKTCSLSMVQFNPFAMMFVT